MFLPKLLIIGHGRHGKDTVCEILQNDYGFAFSSSSQFCSRLFIFNQLREKYGYTCDKECFDDRHNRRADWYDAICAYNSKDPSKLGREIFKENDIYCGLRCKKEYHAMRNTGLFDYVIWVDRSDHLPLESKTSMTLEPWMADFVIDNNGTLEELHFNTHQLISHLLKLDTSS
jgi:hypothetical protein